MCDPLTIAGAALTAGSMVANQAAQSRVAKAQKGAMVAERIRQQGYQDEAQALNDQSRQRYDKFGEGEDAKAKQLAEYFKNSDNAQPGTTGAGTPAEPTVNSSSNIVTQEAAKQKAKVDAYGDQQSEALGKMRGFGDFLGDTSRLQARDASRVGQVGGFMRGSSSVLPLELEAAKSKGAGLGFLGDVLKIGGSVGTAAGLAGAGPGSFGEIFGSQGSLARLAQTGRTGFIGPLQ